MILRGGCPSVLKLVVGITIKAGAVGLQGIAALARGHEAFLHSALSKVTELSDKVAGFVFDVREHVCHAVTLFFLSVNGAAVFKVHAHHIGITEQVMNIAQRFLISTYQEYGYVVILPTIMM